jgi:hypothetical protein
LRDYLDLDGKNSPIGGSKDDIVLRGRRRVIKDSESLLLNVYWMDHHAQEMALAKRGLRAKTKELTKGSVL